MLKRCVVLLLTCCLLSAACDEEAREQSLDDTAKENDDTLVAVDTPSTDTNTGETTLPTDIADTGEPLPALDVPDAIYVAQAGIGVPKSLEITDQGPALSNPLELGPERAFQYGLGEARLSYMLVSPDGATVVVGLVTGDQRTHFFAMSTRPETRPGVPTEALGVAEAFRHEAAFTSDSQSFVWADGAQLFLAPVDASAPPLLLASIGNLPPPPAYQELDRLRFVESANRIAFDFQRDARQNGSQVYTARLDGSEAQAPVMLTPNDGTQYHVQAGLPGGRLVYSHSGAFWVQAADGQTPAVRVTPSLRRAGGLVVPPNSERLVVELYDTPSLPRDLATVALDGSDAEAPLVLDSGLSSVDAIVTPDGNTIIYDAKALDGTYVVRYVAVDGSAGGQLGPAFPSALHLAGFNADASSVLGCHENTLIAISRTATPTTPHEVLADATTWGGTECSWLGMTAGGTHAVFQSRAPTPASWEYWTVDVSGSGDATRLETEGRRPEVTPDGVVWWTPVDISFLGLLSDFKRWGLITFPINGVVDEARVIQSDFPHSVVYHVTGEDRGWYSTDPYLIEPRQRLLSKEVLGGALRDVVGEHLVIEEFVDSAARLSVLHARLPRDSALLQVAPDGPWTVAASQSALLAVMGSPGAWRVEAFPWDGQPSWTVMELTSQSVMGMTWVEATEEVVVLNVENFGAGGIQVLAAPIDGSAAPTVMGAAVLEWPMELSAVPGQGRVLLTLGSNDSAVPHPISVANLRTDGSDAGAMPTLANGSHALWTFEDRGDLLSPGSGPPRTVSTTADGQWIAMRTHDGIWGVRSDLSETNQVFDASNRTLFVTGLNERAWLASDDRTLVGWDHEANRLVAGAIDGTTSEERTVGPTLALPFWNNAPERIQVAETHVVAWLQEEGATESALWVMPLSGEEGWRMEHAGNGELEALSPEGDVAVYRCLEDIGSGLCAIKLDEPAAVPHELAVIGTKNDAVERFVGWLPWQE